MSQLTFTGGARRFRSAYEEPEDHEEPPPTQDGRARIRVCSAIELKNKFGGARVRPPLFADERGTEIVVLLSCGSGRLALERENAKWWLVRELPGRTDEPAGNLSTERQERKP